MLSGGQTYMKGEAADGVGGAAIDVWGCLEQTVANEVSLAAPAFPFAFPGQASPRREPQGSTTAARKESRRLHQATG